MRDFEFSALPHLNPNTEQLSAVIRAEPSDFQVAEVLPFEPDGVGSHAWLYIQKTNTNTDWLATELAKFSGVKPVDVGYAGLKDRHGVTSQWFSVNLQGIEEPNWSAFENDSIRILEHTYHGKKLKRGVLKGNRFMLTLTQLKGDRESWESSLARVKYQGVPNYFAEQRFGHQMNNLRKVEAWFEQGKKPKKRNQKSIYLSAARSWLFNLIVAQRIENKQFDRALTGDLMLLAGTKASHFHIEQLDDSITNRLVEHDIQITAALCGRGNPQNTDDSLAVEQQVTDQWQLWIDGVNRAGVDRSYRAIRVLPQQMNWKISDDQHLTIEFELPAGSYATAVLREIAAISDAQQRNYSDSILIEQNKIEKGAANA
jgi:tRNA pseudouridine13 synthase